MQLSVEILLLLGAVNLAKALPSLEADLTSARIVNGEAVDITEIPYQAALRRRATSGWTHMCGAVIINKRALLTAAHCINVYVSQPSSLRVVVGTSYRLIGGKSYEVSRVVAHDSYSSITLENDIGMLITSKEITFSSSADAIAFAPLNFDLPVGTKALVSGYGTTSYDGSTSSILLAATVKIVAQETCARAYLRIASITSGMVCANATNPPRDACQGDSGGPLVALGRLVGIVSWGEGCADSVYPGVYTRISEYSSWIEEKLKLID